MALRSTAAVATDALARDPFGAPAVLFESEEQAEGALRAMGAACRVAIGVPRPVYTWIGGGARGSVTVERD